MKTKRACVGRITVGMPGALVSLLALCSCGLAFAADPPFGVPIRLSFKFILNATNARPASGGMNTPEEIALQVARGNWILGHSHQKSELRLHETEIVNVTNASHFYGATTEDMGDLCSTAQLAPGPFHWRYDAINIYITAGDDSAAAYFPPYNNFIIVCQNVFETTLIHELGHSLSLYHTHENQTDPCTNTPCGTGCVPGYNDYCSDTLLDAECWETLDHVAGGNFGGQAYLDLSEDERHQVDVVLWNVMSYHHGDDRSMFSACQLNRMSAQAYEDRHWMLSKIPVYVDADGVFSTTSGSWIYPYHTIQQAMSADAIENRVLVLKTGTHGKPSNPIRAHTDIVTRNGASVVRDARKPYSLPYRLEESKNAGVREAIVRAQACDRQKDLAGVITNLLVAEESATGREKDSIRLELAQRFRDSQRAAEAAVWFERVAESADQPTLRQHALTKAGLMRTAAEKQRREKEASESKGKQK